jgi:hypothetical protein
MLRGAGNIRDDVRELPHDFDVAGTASSPLGSEFIYHR